MNMKSITTALIFTVATAYSAATLASGGADANAFNKAYAEAEAAFKKSDGAEAAWTTSEDALKDAKEAAAKGEFENAIKLANLAKSTSEEALAQQAAQKNAKPRL